MKRGALLFLSTVSAALCIRDSQASERFALVVGNEVGAEGNAHLWFAERDAKRFATTIEELGGFAHDHVGVVLDETAVELRARLAEMESEIRHARATGKNTLFVLYYSGHADERGLQLGTESVTYDSLRGLLQSNPADVKIAIVDACESGGLTQVKGARHSDAIAFPLHLEDSAQGVAYITSSAVG